MYTTLSAWPRSSLLVHRACPASSILQQQHLSRLHKSHNHTTPAPCSCGSTTHKTKECLERPRKLQAKWTGEDLARDDVIEDVQFNGWAHKRDAYKGYNADDYREVVERYEKVNAARAEMLRKEEAEKRCA